LEVVRYAIIHVEGRRRASHEAGSGVMAASGLRRPLVLLSRIVVIWLLMMAAPAAMAAENAPGDMVQRDILALYDGRLESAPDSTRVHRYAEMPLNYLGYVVDYWDISKGLPDESALRNVHGILTWFMSPPPPALFAWLQQACARGIRIAIIGDGGVPRGETALAEANGLFAAIGFKFSNSSIDLTYASKVALRDSMIGFERDLDPVLPEYPIVETAATDVVPHLRLEDQRADGVIASTVVLTSPRGGFAADSYFTYEIPGTEFSQWIVDPVAFFSAAFGALPGPVPDVTTISGRRIYLSHIDGDGWNNLSRIARFRDDEMISAAVVQHELVEPYPDLPVTIGVIGADVDPRYGEVSAAQRTARALFKLSQVEVGTHTYTHPFSWPFFARYDRSRELQALGKTELDWADRAMSNVRTISKRLFPVLANSERHSERVVSDHDPPRAYANFSFDLDQEVAGAVQASDSLAPPGKPAVLYQWSGDADPFPEAVARTRALGVRNMNGGDSRVDADAPSIAYVAPISRPVGKERQIYSPDANDYIYMSDDNGREFGFLYFNKTIEATEFPRRLKPIDLYYHMYVGERPAELNVVRRHLDEMRRLELAPITASHYAAIADAFFSTQLIRLDDTSWRVSNRGALQTVRFDDADGLTIDLARSVGVLGERRRGSTLYIALDAAVDDAVVALSPIGSPADAVQDSTPYLISSRWVFSNLQREECGFTADVQGFGAGEMSWGGLHPGSYRVQVRRSNSTLWQADATADASGTMAISVKTDAIEPVHVDVSCAD